MGNAFKKQLRSNASPPGGRTKNRDEAPVSAGASLFTIDQLGKAIEQASNFLLSCQHPDGYWVFDVEADSTISSEYLLLQFYLDRPIEKKRLEAITRYLRKRQLPQGGWPLFDGGEADVSASVKAYLALKLAGDHLNLPHMIRARRYILRKGGAAEVNVFTRITLALFGQLPWRTLPSMPVEIVLLPKWFFFHLHKVSYWSRTVIVPLLILYARRPVRKLSPEQGIAELFIDPPEMLKHLDKFSPGQYRKNLFLLLDRVLKKVEPHMPGVLRQKAIRQAEGWMRERMGPGGIGAIFPAMANAVMALKCLGYNDAHPDVQRGLQAIDDLLVQRREECFCQPCNSPIWDSALGLAAVLEAGADPEDEMVEKAAAWLVAQQHSRKGDWAVRNPTLEPGGWAFQFENSYYPDADDTPMVLLSFLRAGRIDHSPYDRSFARAVNWIIGMQSSDGGWGAFDIDNNYLYLNDIPFADHGALLDPSTSDVTAHCIELLARLGYDRDFPPLARGLRFLQLEQEECGAWYGRWGVNYIYGTWSVLTALRQVGEDMTQPYIRKAVAWLKSCQNMDYGWGESCYSYQDPALAGRGASTPSQTAWALLGLMAAGEVNSVSVQRGILYLLNNQGTVGRWRETQSTGTGFPRVFYLRYHGYSQIFPLWALGVYQRLRTGRQMRLEEVQFSLPEGWLNQGVSPR